MPADEAPPAATLEPARSAVAVRHVGAAAGIAALILAFAAATVTLPTAAALGAGIGLGAAALWLLRRAGAAGQCGLVATPDGLVVRLGTASAELGWRSVESVGALGTGRRVGVDVRAGRVRRRLPGVFAPADLTAWLHRAAELAAAGGRDDLRVDHGELTSARPSQ